MGASTVARVVILLEIAEHLRRWTEVVAVAHHSDVLAQEKTPIEAEAEVAVVMVDLPHVVEVVPSMVKAEKEAVAGAVAHLSAMVAVGVGEVALVDDIIE